jgi:hypothetical protein
MGDPEPEAKAGCVGLSSVALANQDSRDDEADQGDEKARHASGTRDLAVRK